MSQDTEKCLALTLEIEGLLHLLLHRPLNELPPTVKRLLASKSSELATMLAMVDAAGEDVVADNAAVPDGSNKNNENDVLIAGNVEYEQSEDSMPDASQSDAWLTKIDIAQAEEDEADSEAAESERYNNDYYGDIARRRSQANALIQIFTLNDRYRFTRELFGGSSAAFNTILEEISSFGSLSQVENFLSDKQGVDTRQGVGKEFLKILSKHFG